MKTVPKFLWVILAVVLFLLFAVVMMVRHPLPSSDTAEERKPIKLKFGDILDIAYNKESETVVLKVKIKSNLTKDLTVKQNYMNAWEFIKAYTDVKYKELLNPIKESDYDEIVDYALDIGITNAYCQYGGTVSDSFVPEFNFEGIKKLHS